VITFLKKSLNPLRFPWNHRVFNDIEAGRARLALIGVQPPGPFESKPLFADEFVCVVAENHPLPGRR
jgi:DNA-binding transcriptional LysR family regulator